ncbi:DUF1604 domain containing protein [Nitzschia inconspicua]|uniref:DUF1604 domain containing protein n=1 Tax=Nitzschia inconspicua TaxID=303405 RepID=A0A9K3KHP4_9STRA|nr:DUF1604 domain containing protein [Nitzschia inconspicua]
MSASSQRPVYIPKNRRRNRDPTSNHYKNPPERPLLTGRKRPHEQPRFHGAFTGGFSAGHFNTVATKEGWTPSTTKKTDQRLEDFMDEEDHAEWGGPTRIREDFAGLGASSQTDKLSSVLSESSAPLFGLESVLEIKHETVGPRLLRRLGWREGGTAFVPDETSESHPSNAAVSNDDKDEDEALAKIHLSKKRVRRFQLQTNRTKLPPPKLDQCGLGFEPYQDAPEFQRYRERRKQLAQDRATYNQRDNVYRISDVAEQTDDGRDRNMPSRSSNLETANERNEYLSYETAEDFVGKRSSGGFALRDDEDDAYDNRQSLRGDRAQKMIGTNLGEDYNMEVYEHESSDDDDHFGSTTSKSASSKKQPTANLFAAWAGGNADSSSGKKDLDTPVNAPKTVMTSSGQPPLPGFVLGSSTSINRKRYPGPDIPRDYEVQQHQFGENEHPEVYQTISRAMKLQQEDEIAKAGHSNVAQVRQQQQHNTRPMSSNFTALADAMKSRFTSGSTPSKKIDPASQEQVSQHPAGLYLPKPIKKDSSQESNGVSETAPTKVSMTVTRTVSSFSPVPLVCKRFRVNVPSHVPKGSGAVAADARSTEAAYFEKEIMSAAKHHVKESQNDSQMKIASTNDGHFEEEEASNGIDRPSLEKLQSIFEADSDISTSDEEVESSNETEQHFDEATDAVGEDKELVAAAEAGGGDDDDFVSETRQQIVKYLPRTLAKTDEQSRLDGNGTDSSSESSHRHKKKKSRKKEKKKKRKHKRSRSPSRDSDSERRRKKKKEKKRKR